VEELIKELSKDTYDMALEISKLIVKKEDLFTLPLALVFVLKQITENLDKKERKSYYQIVRSCIYAAEQKK
jgi:hypothetical protein